MTKRKTGFFRIHKPPKQCRNCSVNGATVRELYYYQHSYNRFILREDAYVPDPIALENIGIGEYFDVRMAN